MSIKTLMTAEELLEQADELGPCELVKGEIVPMPPAGEEHSEVTSNAGIKLGVWAKTNGRGRVLMGEPGVITERDPDTVRGADAIYISYSRRPKGQRAKGFLAAPPELVVEVAGQRQSWREVMRKVAEYLAMGVDRVWVLNPDRQTVHVYRSDEEPRVYRSADTLTDEDILPGFSCAVAELFED